MKKKFFLLACILIVSDLFSQTLTFSLNNDITVQDTNLDGYYSFEQGNIFKQSNNGSGLGVDTFDPLSIQICLYNEEENKRFYFPIEYISLNNSSLKINKKITEYYWLPEYYYHFNEGNAQLNILKNEPYWKNFKNYTEDQSATWIDFFGVKRFYFGDFYFICFGSYGYNDVDFLAVLEKESENKLVYNVKNIYSHYFDYKYKYTNSYKNEPDFLPLFKRETPFKIIFTIDGDYMYMYIDEVSDKNLFQTLVRTTPEACDQIENYILGKSKNLSAVVMPKHGTNKSTKTVSTPSTNVAVNKTMSTNCNLKLRSGEATSTQVLTVMSAGTKVKILELGKTETIDGINSNWVKVEIISGKDRDGKILKSGTTGWCYGGYLQ